MDNWIKLPDVYVKGDCNLPPKITYHAKYHEYVSEKVLLTDGSDVYLGRIAYINYIEKNTSFFVCLKDGGSYHLHNIKAWMPVPKIPKELL